jgi:hypothetical protein
MISIFCTLQNRVAREGFLCRSLQLTFVQTFNYLQILSHIAEAQGVKGLWQSLCIDIQTLYFGCGQLVPSILGGVTHVDFAIFPESTLSHIFCDLKISDNSFLHPEYIFWHAVVTFP